MIGPDRTGFDLTVTVSASQRTLTVSWNSCRGTANYSVTPFNMKDAFPISNVDVNRSYICSSVIPNFYVIQNGECDAVFLEALTADHVL